MKNNLNVLNVLKESRNHLKTVQIIQYKFNTFAYKLLKPSTLNVTLNIHSSFLVMDEFKRYNSWKSDFRQHWYLLDSEPCRQITNNLKHPSHIIPFNKVLAVQTVTPALLNSLQTAAIVANSQRPLWVPDQAHWCWERWELWIDPVVIGLEGDPSPRRSGPGSCVHPSQLKPSPAAFLLD